jgi:hypothetical protein
VNEPSFDPPIFEPLDKIVQGVLKFGKDQQPLLRTVEEPLSLHQALELGEFSFGAGRFHFTVNLF